MGMKRRVETYYQEGMWKNRIAGNMRASSRHSTKAEAEAHGQEMARKLGLEHVVKNPDGTIRK
jgi:hypothetical protein